MGELMCLGPSSTSGVGGRYEGQEVEVFSAPRVRGSMVERLGGSSEGGIEVNSRDREPRLKVE